MAVKVPMHWAVVEDATGLVTNVILWDGVADHAAPAGHSLVQLDEGAWIGWRWDGASFIPPPPETQPAGET